MDISPGFIILVIISLVVSTFHHSLEKREENDKVRENRGPVFGNRNFRTNLGEEKEESYMNFIATDADEVDSISSSLESRIERSADKDVSSDLENTRGKTKRNLQTILAETKVKLHKTGKKIKENFDRSSKKIKGLLEKTGTKIKNGLTGLSTSGKRSLDDFDEKKEKFENVHGENDNFRKIKKRNINVETDKGEINGGYNRKQRNDVGVSHVLRRNVNGKEITDGKTKTCFPGRRRGGGGGTGDSDGNGGGQSGEGEIEGEPERVRSGRNGGRGGGGGRRSNGWTSRKGRRRQGSSGSDVGANGNSTTTSRNNTTTQDSEWI